MIKNRIHRYVKRLFPGMIAIVMMCGIPLSVNATGEEMGFPADMDQSAIAAEVAERINGVVGFGNVPRKITVQEVDLSKALRYYIGKDIFALDTIDFEEVKQTLESADLTEGDYLFQVPVQVDNVVCVVGVECRMPLREGIREDLTDEEIAQAEQNVGQWITSGVKVYEEGKPFSNEYEIAKEITGIDDVTPLILWSLPYFKGRVALYPDDAGNVGTVVPINASWGVEWDFLDLDPEEFTGTFDYAELKNHINNLPPRESMEEVAGGSGEIIYGGGGGTTQVAETVEAVDTSSSVPEKQATGMSAWNITLIVLAVLAVGVSVTAFIRSKKRQNQG